MDLVTRDLLLVGRMCAHSSLFFRLLFIRFSAFLGIAFQVLVNIDHMEWRFALPLPTIGLVFAIVSVAGSIGGAFTGTSAPNELATCICSIFPQYISLLCT